MKPYSQACDNNKDPILNEIAPRLSGCKSLLEIGSGTGQHAVYFSENIPTLHWHTSDRRENHQGIIEWIEESESSNLEYPLLLDVLKSTWPERKFDAVYTANTCHIMHWPDVIAMFDGVSNILSAEGNFIIYGPFNYNGDYTSESNQYFDQMLKKRDPDSGLRNHEDLIGLASNNSIVLDEDIPMPANNRLLIFRKIK